MTRALRCEQQSGRLEPIRWWAYPILLAGVARAFDAADRRVPFDVLISGLLDEPAHLATAALGLLVLACFIDVPRRFYVAARIASVAIDLDHIPLYLGQGLLSDGSCDLRAIAIRNFRVGRRI